MGYDATWYGSRPRYRPHCIRRGPSCSQTGHSSPPPSFRPCLLWLRSPISATAELLFSPSHASVNLSESYHERFHCALKVSLHYRVQSETAETFLTSSGRWPLSRRAAVVFVGCPASGARDRLSGRPGEGTRAVRRSAVAVGRRRGSGRSQATGGAGRQQSGGRPRRRGRRWWRVDPGLSSVQSVFHEVRPRRRETRRRRRATRRHLQYVSGTCRIVNDNEIYTAVTREISGASWQLIYCDLTYVEETLLFNNFFSDCRYMPSLRRYSPIKLCHGAQMAIFA